MRELKFRWWDSSREKMCFPEKIPNGCDTQRERLMQFTGLKDKNGKDIYEGDILGGIFGDGFIGYCDICKCLQYTCKDFGCLSCSGDLHWSEVVEEDGRLEVVGNIYENPELLSGERTGNESPPPAVNNIK
jgi:uncharacterized phage protein (TIGR01671 family)